ncbi:type II toxin-antitoxin system prevent-host-death family antitoxin [Enterococcus faecalis]|uniref:type II toxin-antitoxin system prevent-host-death family antitoxin n=1 Tax=Enterococcus faecalis TaxID=1351 RepID=UPI0012E2AEE1|nr:type II toxin-antitoxin system prevent-host-death family antitoxin [Enterococcus faecalis]EGO5016444.1 type II toxin-antitoxin system prevent-host-death family antitoxin [Enterococcus faecalis]EGO6562260.1 type II toxin-antitoxin system prevent-host-death family antitoxin [Enterococcus faecalis]EGO7560217.1 type II toxin-antitoxin system prevent-host-death family antitoxin [Enterococcus faecalis]EGO7742215.1 type II toxin-antitoxin system prevent-host-death family antitoxin [Enterococcus fae
MPIIKPVSDLRNYNTVLSEVSEGNPVYLTKNGYGKYAVVDLAEYEKIQASMKLLAELAEAEQEIADGVALIPQEDIDKEFGLA